MKLVHIGVHFPDDSRSLCGGKGGDFIVSGPQELRGRSEEPCPKCLERYKKRDEVLARGLTDVEEAVLLRVQAGESPFRHDLTFDKVESALNEMQLAGLWLWESFLYRKMTAWGIEALRRKKARKAS